MCGIAGIVSLNNSIDVNLVIKMNQSLEHRGPDDEGFLGVGLTDKAIYNLYSTESQVKHGYHISSFNHVPMGMLLGHKRLSIIDLSPAGHQPMPYDNGRLWIVYNGEIFNYRELREELKSIGYTFQTNSDTEVILASYQEWGSNCVKHFIGDWAFVIYDTKKEALFLSRDRFGIKPLYYYYSPSLRLFAFASEIKSLLCLPYVESDINREKCFEFLVFSIQEHSSETLYKDVYQVEPGFNLIVDLNTLQLSHKQYYDVQYTSSVGDYNPTKAGSYADDIRELLIDSVKLRLRADVPIGTCLSGGLDSSTIVVIVNKLLKEGRVPLDQIGERQKTFTISFPGETIDETEFAKLIVDHTGAKGHFISPTIEGLHQEIKNLIWFQDEPFGGASLYIQWKVMEEASKEVRVILDGQGGDEVFGGYSIYRSAFFSQLVRTFNLGKLVRELAGTFKLTKSIRQMLTELKALPIQLAPDFLKILLYTTWKKGLIKKTSHDLKIDYSTISSKFLLSFTRNLNEVLYMYLTKYSLPKYLHFEDRNSMAFSLESRTPFTDHRLVDYLFSIPACYKYRDGWSKWLLRLAMKDLLPKEILWRKDKIGFAPSGTMSEYNRVRIFEIWSHTIEQFRNSNLLKDAVSVWQ